MESPQKIFLKKVAYRPEEFSEKIHVCILESPQKLFFKYPYLCPGESL